MHQSLQLRTITSSKENPINKSPWRRGFLPIVLAFFALSRMAHAGLPLPVPDGGYPNRNTAEGQDALLNLTTGTDNTAIGFTALTSNMTGSFNTANGTNALESNTTGEYNSAYGYRALTNNINGRANTANGESALYSNTTGNYNVACGSSALYKNITGGYNTATGAIALSANTSGHDNTADGVLALVGNTTGSYNTANGRGALYSNTSGGLNTADGATVLLHNKTGSLNTAVGRSALYNNITGGNNIALGASAAFNLTTGSNNIEIGNPGVAAESSTIRLGTAQQATYVAGISGKVVPAGVTVVVGANGKLGTVVSSRRFKEEIKPMDTASEAILALKPVTFRYKKELDAGKTPQFGLVAEEVEKVSPDLVARDEEGKIYTVRYEAVNAMLLNEFLKEHSKVQDLKVAVSQQQREIETLTQTLEEQAAQIRRVSAGISIKQPIHGL